VSHSSRSFSARKTRSRDITKQFVLANLGLTGHADMTVRHQSPIFAAAVEPILIAHAAAVTGLSDTKLDQRVWRLCS